MAMILITHDFGIVAETCDDIAVVYAGQIVECGRVEQVFHNKLHPYTKGLFGSIPLLTGDAERLSSIEGMSPDPSRLPKGCYFSPRCKYCTQECTAEGTIPLKDMGDGHLCRCLKAQEIIAGSAEGSESRR